MSTSGLNSAGIPNSMTQSFSNKARTPTADHPPSVALNRSNRKFSRSQSSLTEKEQEVIDDCLLLSNVDMLPNNIGDEIK